MFPTDERRRRGGSDTCWADACRSSIRRTCTVACALVTSLCPSLKRGALCLLLWCSLVEPTPCVPRRSPWRQFSHPCKNCHLFCLRGSGALRAPLPARRMPWHFLRGGESCCHSESLGTQGVGSTEEHHNNGLFHTVRQCRNDSENNERSTSLALRARGRRPALQCHTAGPPSPRERRAREDLSILCRG